MYKQMQLFTDSFNTQKAVTESLWRSAKASNLSRDQIVDAMNDMAERYGVNMVQGCGKLTVDALEKWLNVQDNSRQMPTRALPIFCAVVGDHSAISAIAAPLGLSIMNRDDEKLLKWARAYHKSKALRTEMRKLEAEI